VLGIGGELGKTGGELVGGDSGGVTVGGDGAEGVTVPGTFVGGPYGVAGTKSAGTPSAGMFGSSGGGAGNRGTIGSQPGGSKGNSGFQLTLQRRAVERSDTET
jgi:hypothetical protein